MYTIKKGTVNDIESIWMIIERTWLESQITIKDRPELIRMLNLTHSIKKIKLEILNNYQRYILVQEKECPVAFASYSLGEIHPPDFRIHKIYNLPGTEGKGYNKILILHIEGLAIERGSRKLLVKVGLLEKKEYFESLGFSEITHPANPDAFKPDNGFTMVKLL
jgi:N-acetylglutamate synthase-like GNAT family acetyltransferase